MGKYGTTYNQRRQEHSESYLRALQQAKPMSDVPVQDPVSLSLGSGLRGPTNRREGVPTVSA